MPIRDNILYGNNSNIEDELILNYLYELEMFKEKPYDLDRLIDNTSLSSGQMQKWLTRSLLADPEYYYLTKQWQLDDDSNENIVF